MYYIIVCILLLSAEIIYFHLANRFNIIDKPNTRSSHSQITLRGGGIIFYFGALTYFFTSNQEYPWFIVGLTLITGISFIDDIYSVSQKTRLIFHFIAMLLMFYQWDMQNAPWWYIPIALVICTGIINAYNFMDGINGITGGYSFVILLMLAYVNINTIQFITPDFIWIMLMAVSIFNYFNFRKKAKCFAGDVGSVSIAFILLFLIGKLILITHDLSYIILLIVYGVDSTLTIIHRIILHENISLPHRKHLYQIMANELSIPHWVVSVNYMILQIIIFIGYIKLYEYKYYYFAIVLTLLCLVYYLFMKKFFQLHKINT